MTSPTLTAGKSHRRLRPRPARPAGGFTLIEILVVISILVVLMGILLPAVNRARQQAARARAGHDLQSVAVALEAYKTDHGGYPRVTGAPVATHVGYDGAIVLCQALLAPGNPDDLDADGKPSPGFRAAAGGKVYGPYLQADQFRAAHPTDPANTDPALFAFIDRFDKPILYFPASAAKPNVKVAPVGNLPAPYVDARTAEPSSDFSLYDARDNLGAFERTAGDPGALTRVRLLLGDVQGAATGSPPDGVVGPSETEVSRPFLLWSAGPDDLFGPDALDTNAAAKCDDVTNFR